MAPLLEISDLRTEIRLKHATVHAVDGRRSTLPGRDPRDRRRVGLRQDDDRAVDHAPAAPRRPIVGGSISWTAGHLPARRRRMRRVRGNEIGMIFQDPMTSLNPTMTIGDQIAESVHAAPRVAREQALARAVEVLGLVGMPQPQQRVGHTRTSSPAACASG